MTSSAPEFDYENIIKLIDNKNAVNGELENDRSALESKRWEALQEYYGAKSGRDLEKSKHNLLRTIISNRSKFEKPVDEQHKLIDEKLQEVQKMCEEMEARFEKENGNFVKNMTSLSDQLKKLPEKFDNETVRQKIVQSKASLDVLEQHIIHTKKEMESLSVPAQVFEDFTDVGHLKKAAELILKEMDHEAGLKMRKLFAEVRQQNEYLARSIGDIKVKYDI